MKEKDQHENPRGKKIDRDGDRDNDEERERHSKMRDISTMT